MKKQREQNMQMPYVGKNMALKGDGVVSSALAPNPEILVHVALHADSFTSLDRLPKCGLTEARLSAKKVCAF